jgi:uncharacterized protein YcbK (DUF882 family)
MVSGNVGKERQRPKKGKLVWYHYIHEIIHEDGLKGHKDKEIELSEYELVMNIKKHEQQFKMKYVIVLNYVGKQMQKAKKKRASQVTRESFHPAPRA